MHQRAGFVHQMAIAPTTPKIHQKNMLSKPENLTPYSTERKRNFNYRTMPKPYQNTTKNTPKNKPHKAQTLRGMQSYLNKIKAYSA